MKLMKTLLSQEQDGEFPTLLGRKRIFQSRSVHTIDENKRPRTLRESIMIGIVISHVWPSVSPVS